MSKVPTHILASRFATLTLITGIALASWPATIFAGAILPFILWVTTGVLIFFAWSTSPRRRHRLEQQGR